MGKPLLYFSIRAQHRPKKRDRISGLANEGGKPEWLQALKQSNGLPSAVLVYDSYQVDLLIPAFLLLQAW